MSEAKRLLEQATPLPWDRMPVEQDYTSCEWSSADEALIVYAVNRLPDYEAAVEALEQIDSACTVFLTMADKYHPNGGPAPAWLDFIRDRQNEARAALARLRESEAERA